MNEVFAEPDQSISSLFENEEDGEGSMGLVSVDNQYTKRFSQNVAENGRKAFTVWQLALTYMYTTPGIPSIYQGAESPMYGEGRPERQKMVVCSSGDGEIC